MRSGGCLCVRRVCLLAFSAVVGGALLLVASTLQAAAPQPVVAIHVSELTQALENMPAAATTPSGAGTSGFEWWVTAWHYHAIYETVEESLRSDGTQFVEVSDNDIGSGRLLNSDGTPRYPIVISLAGEAVQDGEVTALLNYVNAGGTLLLGSSSLTRRPDGTTRGDFALAAAMGLHMANASLVNWNQNSTFTKTLDHRLVNHIPDGLLTWGMALGADDITAGLSPSHGVLEAHYAWTVTSSGAQVLAMGNAGPLLTVNQYGNGRIIYHGAMQPLLGHNGYHAIYYSYAIFRNAIAWAFESLSAPVIRLSPWRYPYDAAMVVRHDFEDNPDLINSIEASAQVESTFGAHGDYYFCTGALRVNMTNSSDTIAAMNRAVANYGATIGSHNGGLTNPVNPNLPADAYDYWHWGPDEALDVTPPGYASGLDYATVSISNSFNDVEGWVGTSPSRRIWVAPSFNANREPSYNLLAQLGVLTTGEQMLTPFPHWILSNQTRGRRYPMLSLPTTQWYLGNSSLQALDDHTTASMHSCIDAYYTVGGLINLYGHIPSTDSREFQALNYSSTKPRLWRANALGVYDWWTSRSAVTMTGTYSPSGPTSVVTIAVNGASDPDTAVEIAVPSWQGGIGTVSQVLVNGTAATYRTNNDGIKVRVGAGASTVAITYNQQPRANDDTFNVDIGRTLTVPAPGVLANDQSASGSALRATLVSGPSHGTLNLGANGGFAYTAAAGFTGSDSFTYRANDGVADSATATVTLPVTQSIVSFADNFSRTNDPGTLAPWTAAAGTWTVTGGAMLATAPAASLGLAYAPGSWTDYTVQAQLQFASGSWFEAGLGGRYDEASGSRYSVLICPQGSLNSQTVLRLLKFYGWTSWNWIPMQEVILPPMGTTAHMVQLAFKGNLISVAFDGTAVMNVADNGFDGSPAFVRPGGISIDLFTDNDIDQMVIDNVTVTTVQAAIGGPVLTINVDNQSRAYGQNNPALTGTLNGVVNGDNITATFATAATAASGVGNYPIVPVLSDPNGRLGNYTVITNTGTLLVTPALLTVNATALSKIYDGLTNASVVLSDNRIAGDSLNVTSGAAAFADKNVGSAKAVNVSGLVLGGASASNYVLNATTISTAANITARPLAVTAIAASKVYDGTTTALVTLNDNRVAGDSMSAKYASAGFADKNVGAGKTVTVAGIGIAGADAGNYTWNASTTAIADVTAAPLTLTADNKSRTYGATNPVLTGAFGGFVAGESQGTAVSGGANFATTATTNSPIGTYPITVTAGTLRATNYVIIYVNGTLAVTPAALLVKANDATRPAGQTNPVFTATISGWVNGVDTNQLSGTLVFTTSATVDSPAGTYAIVPSGYTSTNYSITYSNGLLTVSAGSARALVVTANSASRGYGATNPVFTGSIVGLQSGDNITATYSTVATQRSGVGTYPIMPILNDPNGHLSNYSVTTNNGTLTVTQSVLTVTADNKTRNIGQSNPVLTGSIVGLQNSDNITASYATIATTNSPAGVYPITISLSDPDQRLMNYAQVLRPGSLTILAPPVITTQPVSQTNGAGATVSFSVVANGSQPMSYQWLKETSPILGATNSVFTLSNITNANAGMYCVVVSNSAGAVTSSNAALTVSSGLVITSQPASRTNDAGTVATFAVGASGSSPMTFQWMKNGSTRLTEGRGITGATKAILTISNVLGDDRGSYTVVVSNSTGRVVSSPATLTVNDPVISRQPSNVMSSAGATVRFTVAAAGASLNYRWYKNGSRMHERDDVSGVTTPTLTLNHVGSDDQARYTVMVSDDYGSVTSSAATLTLYTPPSLPDISLKIVNEMKTLTVTNTARDVNVGATNLRYTLVSPPSGATISSNGIITWTPSESQGPGLNSITTVVMETAPPYLSDTNTFMVLVVEVNRVPVLPVVANMTVYMSASLVVTNTASDPDGPNDILVYSLVNPPSGATINGNGVIRWTPRATGRFVITTLVTDYSIWSLTQTSLCATNSFTVDVVRRPAFAIRASGSTDPVSTVKMTPLGKFDNEFRVQVDGPLGPEYILERANNIVDTNWTVIQALTPSSVPFTMTDTNAAGLCNGIYRVRLSPQAVP